MNIEISRDLLTGELSVVETAVLSEYHKSDTYESWGYATEKRSLLAWNRLCSERVEQIRKEKFKGAEKIMNIFEEVGGLD